MNHIRQNKPSINRLEKKYNRIRDFCIWICMITLPSLPVCAAREQLGLAVDDKVTDQLFADFGRVYIETFRIDGLNATLDVTIEDTQGIDEYWLLDFQPYQYSTDSPPINEVTAYLSASHTGQCSSVEQDQIWSDDYFHDDFFQNHTATGDKLLFTDFTRGTVNQNGVRSDEIKFHGDVDTFLTCQRTDGSNIWASSVYDEEIEYTTVLYATNLRPQSNWQPDTSFQIPAVGFVQNNIHLIWRLARTVIVNFIITSEAIEHIDLFALFDFAIVEPALLADGLTPDIEYTRLFMSFSTYVPIEHSAMLVWIENTVTYDPLNPENALTEVVVDPPSVFADTPLCNIRDPDYCIQSWYYEFVLLLDITELSVEMPVEATGAFGFKFDLYECSDVATGTGCALKADIEEPFHVLIDLTLQSTVSAQDEEGDGIEVEIISVTNDAGEDVRNGVVHNMENVTLAVVFYPAFLREKYILELQLFMFCKGEELVDVTQGCLASPEEERFTSFISEEFTYTYDAQEDPDFVLNPTTPSPPGFRPGWSEWGFWKPCSKTCGSGLRSRTRVCESNSPQVDCIGVSKETERCTMPACEIYTDEEGNVLQYETTDTDLDYFDSISYCENKGGRLARMSSTGLQKHLLRQYGTELYPRYNIENACKESSSLDWPAEDNMTSSPLLLEDTIPCDGLLTSWTIRVNNTASLALFVWRNFSVNDGSFEVVGINVIKITDVGLNNYPIPRHEYIQVRQGDGIGLAWNVQALSIQLGPDFLEGVEDLSSATSSEYGFEEADHSGALLSWSATIDPYPEVLPYYWISEDSEPDNNCSVLSEVNEPVRVPCNQHLRAICEYDFILVFHAVSGNSENVLDLWESSESHESLSRIHAGQHYKSKLVEDWDQQAIAVDEVKVVLQKYGENVLEIKFDGTGTTKYDWFTKERLVHWPYEEIENYNFFSIRGLHDTENQYIPYRHFYINKRFGGCRNDIGWLVILEEQDQHFKGCAYEMAVPPKKPAFLYSNGSTSGKWLEAAEADSFLIYIKYRELVVVEPPLYDLAFRGVAGNEQEILGFWESSSYSDSAGRITFGQHYKSPLVERWHRSEITVEEVWVQLKEDGETVLDMIFDGHGTDKYNWFTASREIVSPFNGLHGQLNYFDVIGHQGTNRHFFINEFYNGCPSNQGWFVVLDAGTYHPCLWDNSYGTTYPKFLYSNAPGGVSTNWQSGNVGVADELLIFIKYEDKPIVHPPPTYPPPVEYSPDNVPPVVTGRELTSAEYDLDQNTHRSLFMNRPLAAQRVPTTVTAVYTIVPISEKRKRALRHRRNLLASIELPQLQSTSFGSSGCPPYSDFNPLEFSCECWTGYQYNLKTFLCERDDQDIQADLVELLNDAARNETDGVLEAKPSRASYLGYDDCYLFLTIGFWYLFATLYL